MEETYQGPLKVTFESQDDLLGTAAALLNLKTKYRTGSQYIVISGDTIVDPSFIHQMMDTHLRDEATVTLALKHKPSMDSDPSSLRNVRSGDIIGTDSSSTQLLFIASSDDYVDSPMKIKHSLLDGFHAIKFGYNILDSHIYIFSRFAMDLLERQKHISSLKTEFIPFLLRCQYRPKLALSAPKPAKSASHDDFDQDHRHAASHSDSQASTSAKNVSERSSAPPHSTGVLCRIHMIDDTQYCSRVNDLASYIQTNKDIATGKHFFKPSEPVIRGAFIAQDSNIGAKSQIGTDCNIGGSSKIGAKSTIQATVIGRHCQIGDQVKIQGCVLMDHIIVESGSVLVNSVICSNANIGKNCSLTDCTVGPAFTVEAGSKHTHESLSNISTAL